MNTLKEQFHQLEQTMLKNIANSLFQLYFHENATPEELMKYYGWTEQFKESERQGLVDDTRAKLEVEQQVLAFYKQHEVTLIEKYGTKNPTGDLGLPLRTSIGNVAVTRSVDTDAEGDEREGAGQSADNSAGPGIIDAEAHNS